MKKFPLHKRGMLAVQQALHRLPDSKLAPEVLALRMDFRHWLTSKFDLTASELDFINELNPHLVELAAIKSSNWLAQRKLIQFAIVELKAER